jgi:hypothetical protein
MRFLLFAVVEAKKKEYAATLKNQLGKNLPVTVKETRLLKLAAPKQMPSEFYLPCPRDAFLTRLEIIEDESGEVYFGRCRNGHQLMLSATVNSSRG